MSLRINGNFGIDKLDSLNKNKTLPNAKESASVSTLAASDSSLVKRTQSLPFQKTSDINSLYKADIEKLSQPTRSMEELPDFNKTPLKIGIAVEQKQATFYVPNGTLYVEDENGKKEIGTFSDQNFTVRNENNSLVLSTDNGKTVGIYKGKLSVEGNLTPIAINGKKYRGEMEVIINPANPANLHVINDVLLEDYLKGVVPSESPASWPLESLKAQSVAARTYAVGNWKRREELGFDLMSTVSDQMYTGISAERDSSTKAVQETTGKVMTYEGKPINALFFSCSGGQTDSAMDVWGMDLPYIKGVEDFDQNAPKYKWTKSIDNADMQKALKQLGSDIGQIKSIEPLEFTPSKRVKSIKFTGTKGEVTVDGNKFRFAAGMNSTLWTVSEGTKNKGIPQSFNFNGGGWGHGLGMSQYGAKQMAENGKSYDQILNHYYTNVQMSNILDQDNKK